MGPNKMGDIIRPRVVLYGVNEGTAEKVLASGPSEERLLHPGTPHITTAETVALGFPEIPGATREEPT